MTDEPSLAADDGVDEQAAVLDFLLGQHPTQLTLAEVVLALAAGEGFAERDAVERAVGELVRSGWSGVTVRWWSRRGRLSATGSWRLDGREDASPPSRRPPLSAPGWSPSSRKAVRRVLLDFRIFE